VRRTGGGVNQQKKMMRLKDRDKKAIHMLATPTERRAEPATNVIKFGPVEL